MSSSVSIGQRPQRRDTGFPEHFLFGTSRPHPEADQSEGACISHDDVHPDLTMKRSSLSFLHRSKKHKKTVSHGVVAPQLAVASHSNLSLAASNTSTTTQTQAQQQAAEGAASTQRPHNNSQPSIVETPPSPTVSSKYPRDSFATSRRDDDDETPPTSPDDASMRSSRGLFGKFRRH